MHGSKSQINAADGRGSSGAAAAVAATDRNKSGHDEDDGHDNANDDTLLRFPYSRFQRQLTDPLASPAALAALQSS